MKSKKLKSTSIKRHSFITVQATYKSLTGKALPKNEIQNIIKNMYLGGMISVLSKLCSQDLNDKEIIRRFRNYCIKSGRGTLNINHDFIICSQQGLMLLWKWLIVYGNTDTSNMFYNAEGEEEAFYHIIVLNMALIDHYQSPIDENIHYDMFRNLFFNHQSQSHVSLARSVFLYTEIAPQNELFEQGDFMDINSLFLEKYGYSIREYLHVLTTLWSVFSGETVKGKTAITITLNYFALTPFQEAAKKVLKELSLPLEARRSWATDSLSNRWNFRQFLEFPLLEVKEGCYLSFNSKVLGELFINQLYFKIRQIDTNPNSQILNFMGRCFEKHVELFAEKAHNLSNIPYKLIKEFRFNKGDKSPDLLLRLGNKLLAIEVKGNRLSLNSIISNDTDSIDKDLERMILRPLKQLYKCIEKLKLINHSSLDGIEELHLLIVNFGEVPTFKPFESKFQEIKKDFDIPIVGVHHMEVGEYEALMGLISSKKPIHLFRFLNNKLRLKPDESFSNYYHSAFYAKKGNHLINDLFNKYTDETLALLQQYNQSVDVRLEENV